MNCIIKCGFLLSILGIVSGCIVFAESDLGSDQTAMCQCPDLDKLNDENFIIALDRELSQSNSGMSKGGYQGHPCYPIVHQITEHYQEMNDNSDTYSPMDLAKQQELHDQLIQEARDCLEEHPTGLIRSGSTKSLSILMEGYHWCECDHSNA